MRVAPGAWYPLCGRLVASRMSRLILCCHAPVRRSTTPSGSETCAYPSQTASRCGSPRQGDGAWRRLSVLVHDRRDEVRQRLVPGRDPGPFVDEQLLPVGRAVED